MPFLENIAHVRGKVPSEGLSRPVLLGIACFAVAIAVLAAVGVVSSARGDFVVGSYASSSSAATADGQTKDAGVSTHAESAATATWYVHVVGAVKSPGVYAIPPDSRVNDAVKAAGGLTRKADATKVNLARSLVDGEQIVIPRKGEVEPGDSGVSADDSQLYRTETSSGVASDGTVNINRATAEELQGLPGIGEVMAERIVANRDAEGPFTSPEDVKRVSGIGDKKYEAIADLITV